MEFCLRCDICCRFPERNSPLVPFFLNKEKLETTPGFFGFGTHYGSRIDVVRYGNGYICPYFIPEKNLCKIYEKRPLDCRLYPYMVTYDTSYKKVVLVLDNKCLHKEEFPKPQIPPLMEQDIGFINDPQPDTIFIEELDDLTRFVFGSTGRFRKLKIEDGYIIPYLWKDIMNVLYEEETGEVFYGAKGNFIRFPNDGGYVYLRKVLIELKGDRYKDKRNLCNYFEKNYSYNIERLCADMMDQCLGLYKKWAGQKEGQGNEYERALLEDSYYFHRRAFLDFKRLGLEGICIFVEDKLIGYTFGFGRDDTFYILAEITDRQYKGISQFIFREFCRIISDNYIYVNTMDDSGIEGLKKSKLSYHPIR